MRQVVPDYCAALCCLGVTAVRIRVFSLVVLRRTLPYLQPEGRRARGGCGLWESLLCANQATWHDGVSALLLPFIHVCNLGHFGSCQCVVTLRQCCRLTSRQGPSFGHTQCPLMNCISALAGTVGVIMSLNTCSAVACLFVLSVFSPDESTTFIIRVRLDQM